VYVDCLGGPGTCSGSLMTVFSSAVGRRKREKITASCLLSGPSAAASSGLEVGRCLDSVWANVSTQNLLSSVFTAT